MRYYAIQITDEKGKPVNIGPFPNSDIQFTSFADGRNIPGALNVVMDLPIFNWDTPMGAALVQISGISLNDISQASDLNGMNIKIYGGMQKGLPLANPKQAGLLMTGKIQQAFGNWQGTNQSLDLIITAGFGSADDPKNIVLNWKKNTGMGDAVEQALNTAFPGYTINKKINSNLTLSFEDQVEPFQTVGQMAVWLNQISRDIIGGTYQGVHIAARENEFLLYDGSSEQDPIQLDALDLIGQPTWIGGGTITFKAVMRYDLQIGDFVLMPKQSLQFTTSASVSQARKKSAFQGTFMISQARHVGNFRQRDANSWATVFNAVVLTA